MFQRTSCSRQDRSASYFQVSLDAFKVETNHAAADYQLRGHIRSTTTPRSPCVRSAIESNASDVGLWSHKRRLRWIRHLKAKQSVCLSEYLAFIIIIIIINIFVKRHRLLIYGASSIVVGCQPTVNYCNISLSVMSLTYCLYLIIMPPACREGGNKRCFCPSVRPSVRLSVRPSRT